MPNQLLNQALQLIQQMLGVIKTFVLMVWEWSGGKIFAVFHLPWATLPLWKQVFYVLMVAALAWFLYRIFMPILEAIIGIFKAVINLLRTIVEEITDVIIAGAIAIAGAWIILNVNLDPVFAMFGK